MKKENLPGFDGSSAFGGALRFHEPNDQTWLEQWGRNYGSLTPQLDFFASDAFGTYYGIDHSGLVSIFWSETGEVERLGLEESDFFQKIKHDPDGTINFNLYQEAVRRFGKPLPSQHFAFKLETALGGSVAAENIVIMDAVEHMRALAKIAQQIAGVPDGTQFRPTKE
jgi:hypothetical protein